MNTVTCPHCKKNFEISDAFQHEIEERVVKETEEKHKKELEKIKLESQENTAKKLHEQFEDRIKEIKEENSDAKESNKKLRDQLSDYLKQVKSLQEKDDLREIELQKTLIAEREKIREEISKTEHEKSNMEVLELKKQLDDTKKSLEEAQRKAAQKSQQLQGEVLELELENLLITSFPHDEIIPVSKGVNGADIQQIVKSPRGFPCGIILWEFKRTKDWSDKWIGKLKEDMRAAKANIPVIISIDLPQEAKEGFGVKDGVWICSHALILPMANILRKNLLDLGYQKAVSTNKEEKAELLYSYITSHEFQHQVENILDVYKEMRSQIDKERMSFERIWKIREAQTQKIFLSTANIIGSMQGEIGSSTLQIKGLDLLESTTENDDITSNI